MFVHYASFKTTSNSNSTNILINLSDIYPLVVAINKKRSIYKLPTIFYSFRMQFHPI